jgi:hypothetical protein
MVIAFSPLDAIDATKAFVAALDEGSMAGTSVLRAVWLLKPWLHAA